MRDLPEIGRVVWVPRVTQAYSRKVVVVDGEEYYRNVSVLTPAVKPKRVIGHQLWEDYSKNQWIDETHKVYGWDSLWFSTMEEAAAESSRLLLEGQEYYG